MSGDPLYLGIDLGTSGCRLLALNPAGGVEFQCRQAWAEPQRGADGASQQDPALWWRGVWALLREFSQCSDPARVVALALDGTSSSVLLCDAAGTPLGPALMYNDARARAEAARVGQVAPADSAVHGATSALAKLLYLRKYHPRARYVLHQADWVANRLIGEYGDSDENNALKLGYDPRVRRWPDWLDELGVPRQWLPRVSPPGTPWGRLDPTLARRLGWPGRPWVVAGTTDSTASFLATGADQPGDAVTALGSTLVLKILSRQALFVPEYGVYSHRLGDLWLAGGASNSGGAVLLRYFSREQLAELTPRLRPGQPTGLDYYPLGVPGERFPVADPAYPPRLHPRPDDPVVFLQALLEGMARIEQRGYALLQDLGAPSLRAVYSTGGGAANPAWQAIRAECLPVDLRPPRHAEAAYGSALLASRAIIDWDNGALIKN